MFGIVMLSLVMALGSFVNVSAETNQPKSGEELIQIADPYIVESLWDYQIINGEELKSIIGEELYTSLEIRIEEASSEKRQELKRDAVLDVHITVLRAAGATVNRYWWGTKINTYNRTNAINTRNLANSFSGDAGIAVALAAVGIFFIPELGTAATIAGAIVGVISWADSRTWSTVDSLMTNKIDSYRYVLTVDINKWIMEVKCY
ncbi:MAG: hypothetical protein GX778_00575 [Erysipelothrix sp.]|nr:hypothetical protein [Erysipelothrix sp.]